MIKLLQNAIVYTPIFLGESDILIADDKIVSIEKSLPIPNFVDAVFNLSGKILTPGLIDQQIDLIGTNDYQAFDPLDQEVTFDGLIKRGITTAVGLLENNSSASSIKKLYSNLKSLELRGISAFLLSCYFDDDLVAQPELVQDDMILHEKVVGCKIKSISDNIKVNMEFELLKLLKQLKIGSLITGKKGKIHVQIGSEKTRIESIINLFREKDGPIDSISITHVYKTHPLFDQAVEFAKKGGMIEVVSGSNAASAPYCTILEALEKGVSIDNITISSLASNLVQVQKLVQEGNISIDQAIKLITINPAKNHNLINKGSINIGMDADICVFDDAFNLTDVFAKGQQLMKDRLIGKH